jgi:hypothetical protein
MGLLNYIEDEPSLFSGGFLRDGYDPSSMPQGGQAGAVVSRYQPPEPIEASLASPPRSGLPQAAIPTNQLPVVEVTADRSPPVADEGSSALGVAKALGTGFEKGAIGLVGLPGDAVGLGRRLLGYETTDTPYLGSEHLQKLYEENVHGFYKPKGTAEEYAETLGGLLPGFALGEGALLGASKAARYFPSAAARVKRFLQAGQPSGTERFLTRVVSPAALSEAAGQYYKGTEQEKRARMLGAFVGGSGAGLASAGLAGLPNGLWSAVYSNALRGAMKAKTAEAQDARRRRERDAQ